MEHAIRAACDVAGEDGVVVFGSQAILARHPDAPAGLRESMEADIAPGSDDPAVADRIDADLGPESRLHRTHGFYVHGLTLDAAILPAGWERRAVVLRSAGTGGSQGRDRAFVRTLLTEGLVKTAMPKLRVAQLPGSSADPAVLLRRIDLTQRDLAGG